MSALVAIIVRFTPPPEYRLPNAVRPFFNVTARPSI
jgi:hypothetical protein